MSKTHKKASRFFTHRTVRLRRHIRAAVYAQRKKKAAPAGAAFRRMPVVGVEQTYFSIWAIPQYADPDGMWFFTTDFAIPNFEFAPPQEKCGLKVWSMAKENEPLRAVALLFSLLLTEP
ncbi:MAG TPA: hypothetical protein K8V20_02975 [Subdoligranulum variabile]|uniref:Uncharacterized protein n=1 Tax=Subdoligranulum variabile TaxID=214851 RepID=A0A921LMJ8_9FIRM|nr:hypothetical protein [Subdoligranulum variabile]